MADLELRRLMREVSNAQQALAGLAALDKVQDESARRAAEARLGAALEALEAYERRATWPPGREVDGSRH
jgi:hypothetical protein